MIIGITGTLGAGKGTVVGFLKEKGFRHFSVRDFLTEEILKRGLEVNRDSMIMVANDLRLKNGPGYIVEELYRKAALEKGNFVIESVRCVGEVEALRKKGEGGANRAGGFVLWAVDADVETRYSRIVERGSSTDRVSFQDFVRQEESEMINSDPFKQNLKACIEKADVVFRNDWTIGELKSKVEKEIDRVLGGMGEDGSKSEYVRPSWDEYFIEVCKTVAKRATCDRGRSGCVIVKNKHILVTGYVGSPPGVAHCDDVGHQFKKTIHEDGKITNHCVRTTHAEQNAICQAAKLGIPLESSTLYCFMTPCFMCAKSIVGSGIKKVVALKDYHAATDSKNLFQEAGVFLQILDKGVQKYDNM